MDNSSMGPGVCLGGSLPLRFDLVAESLLPGVEELSSESVPISGDRLTLGRLNGSKPGDGSQ